MKKVLVIFTTTLILATFVQYGFNKYEDHIVKRESNKCEQETNDAIEDFAKSIDYNHKSTNGKGGTIVLDVSSVDIGELKDLEIDEPELTYEGQRISYLKLSPSSTKIGFYYSNETKTGYHGDIALGIMDLETRDVKTVYEGGFKTSNWSWLDNNHVEVRYGCGTYCMYAYNIDVRSEEVISKYFIYPPR